MQLKMISDVVDSMKRIDKYTLMLATIVGLTLAISAVATAVWKLFQH